MHFMEPSMATLANFFKGRSEESHSTNGRCWLRPELIEAAAVRPSSNSGSCFVRWKKRTPVTSKTSLARESESLSFTPGDESYFLGNNLVTMTSLWSCSKSRLPSFHFFLLERDRCFPQLKKQPWPPFILPTYILRSFTPKGGDSLNFRALISVRFLVHILLIKTY